MGARSSGGERTPRSSSANSVAHPAGRDCDESSPLRTRLPEVVGAESAAPGAMPEALIHADLSDLELYCRTAAEDAAMAGDGAVEAQPVFVSRAYEALRDLKRKSADAVERARLISLRTPATNVHASLLIFPCGGATPHSMMKVAQLLPAGRPPNSLLSNIDAS